MKASLLVLAIGLYCSAGYGQTNTFPSSGNVGIGTTSPGAKLSFNNLDDGTNQPDGITWYNPNPLVYGIYRTAGTWVAPNYQQLKLSWDTGIILDPGSAYGKSFVDVQGAGLRVPNGNLGIGTTAPASKLHINGSVARETLRIYLQGNSTNYLNMWQGSGGAVIDPIGTGLLYLGYDQPTNVIMGLTGSGVNSGSVGIGTATPGTYKLAVEGKIGAREVNVTTTAWSDYVFNSDYKLRPLREVQQYIEENRHLPEVPSEKEVLANGQNLGEMNAILLRKIEELTLYVLDQQREIEALRQRNASSDLSGKKLEELTLYVIEQNSKMNELSSTVQSLSNELERVNKKLPK